MLQVAWGAWKCDSIMSDDDGKPASRAHVFNGGSQQPRPRTNQPRQEDYTRLHARFRRMCGRRQARMAEQRKRWVVVCQEIRTRAQWSMVCQEIRARAQWSMVCQEIRARVQVQPRHCTRKRSLSWRSVLATLWQSTARSIGVCMA